MIKKIYVSVFQRRECERDDKLILTVGEMQDIEESLLKIGIEPVWFELDEFEDQEIKYEPEPVYPPSETVYAESFCDKIKIIK